MSFVYKAVAEEGTRIQKARVKLLISNCRRTYDDREELVSVENDRKRVNVNKKSSFIWLANSFLEPHE